MSSFASRDVLLAVGASAMGEPAWAGDDKKTTGCTDCTSCTNTTRQPKGERVDDHALDELVSQLDAALA